MQAASRERDSVLSVPRVHMCLYLSVSKSFTNVTLGKDEAVFLGTEMRSRDTERTRGKGILF